ncbi:hypothetical protein UY3_08879 [Chelonia mydas]|uniref:Uncharacterized protein n=1 Tax=Chelonia mydas TaxID=8469 RepID=M7B9Y2_CHEMY|nr:hypothetical protein UY3_08879 [Chelonia mydas]
MDTSEGPEVVERGPNPENEVIDEEVELDDDDVELLAGVSGGVGSQELFSTLEVSSQSQQLFSGDQEAGEEMPIQGKRGKRKARAPFLPSDVEAPLKTRKGVTDAEPSGLPTGLQQLQAASSTAAAPAGRSRQTERTPLRKKQEVGELSSISAWHILHVQTFVKGMLMLLVCTDEFDADCYKNHSWLLNIGSKMI